MDGSAAPFVVPSNCPLLDDAEALNNRGTLVACMPSQCNCPVDIVSSVPIPTIVTPTFTCPAETVEYEVPDGNATYYIQYWNNCVPTVSGLQDGLNPANQGFINQMFCDVSGLYPVAPASIGTAAQGIVSTFPISTGVVNAQTLSNLGLATCDATSSSTCLLYTSPSPRDATLSRMPSSA